MSALGGTRFTSWLTLRNTCSNLFATTVTAIAARITFRIYYTCHHQSLIQSLSLHIQCHSLSLSIAAAKTSKTPSHWRRPLDRTVVCHLASPVLVRDQWPTHGSVSVTELFLLQTFNQSELVSHEQKLYHGAQWSDALTFTQRRISIKGMQALRDVNIAPFPLESYWIIETDEEICIFNLLKLNLLIQLVAPSPCEAMNDRTWSGGGEGVVAILRTSTATTEYRWKWLSVALDNCWIALFLLLNGQTDEE